MSIFKLLFMNLKKQQQFFNEIDQKFNSLLNRLERVSPTKELKKKFTNYFVRSMMKTFFSTR